MARHLPMERADAIALRAAVLGLLADPEVAVRAEAIRAAMAAEGGTRQAADLVDGALSEAGLRVRP